MIDRTRASTAAKYFEASQIERSMFSTMLLAQKHLLAMYVAMDSQTREDLTDILVYTPERFILVSSALALSTALLDLHGISTNAIHQKTAK